MWFLFQVEKDVVECLQKALSRRGVDMNVAALVRTFVHCYSVYLIIYIVIKIVNMIINILYVGEW